MTDPIADYLTRLRNAIMAHHRVVEVPASNLKKAGNYQGCLEVRPCNKTERYPRAEKSV